MRPERLYQWKIPMTPSGMEPATFWLVVQCLNQLRYRVPPCITLYYIILYYIILYYIILYYYKKYIHYSLIKHLLPTRFSIQTLLTHLTITKFCSLPSFFMFDFMHGKLLRPCCAYGKWIKLWNKLYAYQMVTYIEWHIPDVVLIQLILLMMGTWLPETCREYK